MAVLADLRDVALGGGEQGMKLQILFWVKFAGLEVTNTMSLGTGRGLDRLSSIMNWISRSFRSEPLFAHELHGCDHPSLSGLEK